MPIYKALLKYGHSQFIFDIMEYCNPEDIVMREQFYLDNFDFDYNIQAKANATPSRRHRADTLELLRKIATNKKHSVSLSRLTGVRRSETQKKIVKK
jgi:group I intron endonuclease